MVIIDKQKIAEGAQKIPLTSGEDEASVLPVARASRA